MECRACSFVLLICLTLLQAIGPLLHDHIDGVYLRTGLHTPGLAPLTADDRGVQRSHAVAGLHAPVFAAVSLGESPEVALGQLVEPKGRLAVHSQALNAAIVLPKAPAISPRSAIAQTVTAVVAPEPVFAFWPPGRAPPAG